MSRGDGDRHGSRCSLWSIQRRLHLFLRTSQWGRALSRRAEQIPEWALSYDTGDHPPYAYTADVVALAINEAEGSLEVLVVERGAEPFLGQVAIPGGFVDWERDQHSRDAAL